MSNIKTLSNRLNEKKNPHVRATFIVGVAAILLIAGLATLGSLTASADDGGKIRATGTVGPTVPATPVVIMSTQTVGDLVITTRATVFTYVGGLSGTLACTTKQVLNTATGVSHSTANCNFTGTVGDSQVGVMSKIFSSTNNPDYLGIPASGSSLWMAGAGGLKGICGEGDFWTSGGVTTYDYTFRFGKSCKSNSD